MSLRMSDEVWETLTNEAAEEVEGWMEKIIANTPKGEPFDPEEFFGRFEEQFGVPKEWLASVSTNGALQIHHAPDPVSGIVGAVGLVAVGLLIGKRLPHGNEAS